MIINGTANNDDGIGASILEDTSVDLESTLNANWSAGDDAMFGYDGNDTYNVNSLGDAVNEQANQGTDTVVSRLATYTLGANLENLTLDSFGIFGIPFATDGTGNELNNVITGNTRANTLTGLLGNDKLIGNGGNDTLLGGDGNDTLDGGTGIDSMEGGLNNDVYIVDSANDVVTELFLGGHDRVEASLTKTLGAFLEDLTLTGTGAIDGTGNGLGNVVTGNSGNNLLQGLGGFDKLVGNGGADTLDGGTGTDTMEGGSGGDTYQVDSTLDVVTEALAAGTDTVKATVTYTLGNNVENLNQFSAVGAVNGTGNASNNTLTGNNSANLLKGLDGRDSFFASGGNDTLEGGNGTDTLRGGTGADTLRAADAGVSDDGSLDLFVFDTALDPLANVDTIERAWFDASGAETTDDDIQLDIDIFTALRATGGVALTGTLDAAMFQAGSGLTGNGQFDGVGIYQDTDNGYLYYNETATTAGDSVLFAIVNTNTAGGSVALGEAEFVLV